MKAKVVSVNVSGVVSKVRRITKNKTLGMYAVNETARLLQPYVPEREGILKSATGASKPWLLVYGTPYAHYQWNGVSKGGKGLSYTKPTATSHWEKQLDKSRLARALTAFLKGM